MERYKNIGRNSGVLAYEIGNDFIRAQFSDGLIYLYTYTSADPGRIAANEKIGTEC